MTVTSTNDPNSETWDEDQIINNLQEGHERTFEAIYTTYSPALFRFCKQIIDNDQAAEDVVTDSFVALWKSRKNILTVNELRGFLYESARNKCIDYLRRRKRRNKHHQILINRLETMEDAVIVHIVRAEHRRLLLQAVALLPPQRRTILEEMINNNRSAKDIANALNISETTVYTAYSKSLPFLQKILKNGQTIMVIIFLFIALIFIHLAKRIFSI